MIVKTITDEYYFWNWLKKSDSYRNSFSLEGSKAVFNYFDQLSDDLGENIEFDPIAWCCEFSEYDNIDDYNKQHGTNYDLGDTNTPRPELTDETTVLEAENGHLIVAGF